MASTVDAVLTLAACYAFAWIYTDTARRVTGTTSRTLNTRAERDTCIVNAVLTLFTTTTVSITATGTLSKGTCFSGVTNRAVLIDETVTVIVEPIAGLIGYITAASTRVEQTLIDATITVVILEVTNFSDRADISPTDHPTGAAAVEVTGSAQPGETRRTPCRLNDGRAIRHGVGQVIAVVVDAIAYLWITVWHTEIAVTRITNAVTISVILTTVDHLGTVITRITDAIFIFISLIGVGHIRTIVVYATQSVIIRIEADATQGALENQQCEAVARLLTPPLRLSIEVDAP